MSPPPTIFSRKSDFLLAQTRLLSQSLSPSRSWRHQNDNSEDGISERAVDDVLFRLNHTLQQHARRVYAPQASRHVSEQIDQLFLDGGDGIIGASKETGAENLYVGLDFSESDTISSLPTAWALKRDVETHPIEAQRYSELVETLQTLDARRSEVQENALRLRLYNNLLQPFQSGEGSRSVQQNLITKDCEVEKELERTRTLLARVGARLGHLLEQSGPNNNRSPEVDNAMVVDDDEIDEKRKVNDILRRL